MLHQAWLKDIDGDRRQIYIDLEKLQNDFIWIPMFGSMFWMALEPILEIWFKNIGIIGIVEI